MEKAGKPASEVPRVAEMRLLRKDAEAQGMQTDIFYLSCGKDGSGPGLCGCQAGGAGAGEKTGSIHKDRGTEP